MFRVVLAGFLLAVAPALTPTFAIAGDVIQTPPAPPPPDPGIPDVTPPFPPPNDPYGPPSPYSDCVPSQCTIIDWLNPNIPADVWTCIPVDTNGEDLRGRRHRGDTCLPTGETVNQNDTQPNP